MNLPDDASPQRRRRGQELEDAILQAGWDQLLDGGYHRFTIDAVAERAGTSRSVVYRRWADREALLDATLAFGLNQGQRPVPDTGSLRGDILELMRDANQRRAAIAPLLSVFMGAYFEDSGRTLADIRRVAFGARSGATTDAILQRAVERGEADPARLTSRVRSVPVDLFRHDLLMTAKELPDEEILAIVDEVFLPLVRPLPGASPVIP